VVAVGLVGLSALDGPPPPPATPPATAAPGGGSAGSAAGCAGGWVTPERNTRPRYAPLNAIRAQGGVSGSFMVRELRHFTGPDRVPRWYVKASLVERPAFRGRWIVEEREGERPRVLAVAPYDSTGFRSPDWHRFDGRGEPRAVPGLPGRWAGAGADLVRGEGGIALPAPVAGCVADT
jgi:hypothetical protein